MTNKIQNDLERPFVIKDIKLNKSDSRVIIYEVNLSIKKDVYEKNKEWLICHFNDMVTINKFIKADIYCQLNLDPIDDSFVRVYRLTARYYIRSYDELKSYLEIRAKDMRSQVMQKLGDNYTVFRRVFQLQEEIC